MTADIPSLPPPTSTSMPEGRGPLFPVAVSLIVISVLWSFMLMMGMAYYYSVIAAPDADPTTRHMMTTYSLYMLVTLGYSLMLLTGAFSMIRKGSYAWAVATSCLAMVPVLGPCYVMGIPVGIWGLMVLRRPEVRASFTRT